jgi:hypothetical protein
VIARPAGRSPSATASISPVEPDSCWLRRRTACRSFRSRQVEGEEPQNLRAGDFFHEPEGSRILHFDNPSDTDEAVFIDFNLQRSGDPFIIFPAPLTEPVDRRAAPTAPVVQAEASGAAAFADVIADGGTVVLKPGRVLGYVASGTVLLGIDGAEGRVLEAGSTFYALGGGAAAQVVALDGEAKVVTFHLTS